MADRQLFATKMMPDRKWTAVTVETIDEKGQSAGKKILTMFGGHDAGKPEAERLAKMLNEARERHHDKVLVTVTMRDEAIALKTVKDIVRAGKQVWCEKTGDGEWTITTER